MRDEVAGDERGESFGTGRMAAEVGQMVRVVVIVAYNALRIMVLFPNMIENGRGVWSGDELSDRSQARDMSDTAHYINYWHCEGHSVDLTMVAPTLLRIGRVTLAETIESNSDRTSTKKLGSPLIRAHEQPTDENSGHEDPDLDL
jgi:hypothetical protein